jgi:folylpolyglutamate synthase/dihydropteroate synthase
MEKRRMAREVCVKNLKQESKEKRTMFLIFGMQHKKIQSALVSVFNKYLKLVYIQDIL